MVKHLCAGKRDAQLGGNLEGRLSDRVKKGKNEDQELRVEE